MEEIKTVFPKGGKNTAYEKYFTGTSYLQMLTAGAELGLPIGHVTFEPGCRNHWHAHPGGQILLVTGGTGWYQEEGKEARKLIAGDIVEIPRGVKHWHGAAKDSWFAHLSIEADISAGPSCWYEEVTDEEYNAL